MYAIRIDGQGQVAAIVHDEEDAGLRRCLPKRQGFSIGLLHRGGLVAILEEGGASLSRGCQYVDQGTLRTHRGIENNVEAIEVGAGSWGHAATNCTRKKNSLRIVSR